MPGPKPQGDRALTSAERMRRLREKRKAEAAGKPPVVIRYRRTIDRPSTSWSAAIDTLTDCSTDIRSGATTYPPALPTARLLNASTPCWSGATSLTNYRLPISAWIWTGLKDCRWHRRGGAKQHGQTLD